MRSLAEHHDDPGGEGMDVSRVLATLRIGNKALGFVGGFAGEELEGRLLNEGIKSGFTRISGETRTNIIVNEMHNSLQTVFSARGLEISPLEFIQLIHKLEKLAQPDMVIISGSLPPGVHPAIYRKIVEMAKIRGARVLLDTDDDALKTGIQGLPDVIKPNLYEMSRLVGTELKVIDEIISAVRNVHEEGVEIVLVSMGGTGNFRWEKKSNIWLLPLLWR